MPLTTINGYQHYYEDLGEGYFDTRDRLNLVRRLVRRLEDLGLQVQLTGEAAA